MSDKNRNMNDIEDQKTAEQQAFSEEIRRRLAEPGSGKPTLDEFKVMVYKDREKRRKKRNALVACLVAAFIVGFISFEALVPEVGADKNPKETIQTEDGVIIEDGGYGSSVGEENVWVITEWKEVKSLSNAMEYFVYPKYIPNEYTFDYLMISAINESAQTYTYHFNSNNKNLEIEIFLCEGGETAHAIYEAEKVLKCEKGNIYYQNKEKATFQMEDGIIIVNGSMSEIDMIKVIENLN